MFQLDYRRSTDTSAAWSSLTGRSATFEVVGLVPGTKYAFKARGGLRLASSGVVDDASWGEYSVESVYATSGGRSSRGLLMQHLGRVVITFWWQ